MPSERSSSPARPASSARISPKTLLDRGYSVVGIDNLLTGQHRQHRAPREPRLSCSSSTTSPTTSTSTGRSTSCCTGRARRARSTTSSCRFRRSRSARSARTRRSASPRRRTRASCIASTSEVYGDPLEHPQKETYWGNVNPIGPRGVYDEAKRFAEAMTMAYHRYHGRRREDRPHLQHLRPAHAAARRPRGPGLHEPGAARRGRHDLRQRPADAQLLLRHRPGRRHHPADGVERERPGQHRQPARDDDRGDRARRSSG